MNDPDEFLVEDLSLDSVIKAWVTKVLVMNAWNITTTAKVLGVARMTLKKKIRRYQLERPSSDLEIS